MNRDHVIQFVIIPVKRLDDAKSRLSSLLTDNERKEFSLKMLEDVLRTVKSTKPVHATVVVSKDAMVSTIAKLFGVVYLEERKTGLNNSVSKAVDWCVERGATSVLILPADIPLVVSTDLNKIFALGKKVSMVISPSRNERGTNALLLAPPNVCPTSYGPGSFQRHIDEASQLKISFREYKSPRIAFDIDTVEDLKYFASLKAKELGSYKVLEKTGVINKLRIHQ